MKKIVLIINIILLVSLSLTACTSSKNPLDGTSWNLVNYQDASGDLVTPAQGAVVTAQFQADIISGISACNNYSAGYKADKSSLTIDAITTTKQLCTQPGIMELEKAYLDNLTQVKVFNQSEGSLELLTDRGKKLLVFKPAGQ